MRQNLLCRRCWRREGGALLLLAGVVALFFWPLWVAGYRFPKGSGDLWGLLYPVWSFVAEWVRRGVLPLWHNRMMGGDPILADVQYGLFNPLNWPLFLTFPIPQELVLLRGIFPFWLAGAGVYLYLRFSPVWQLRRSSAIIGAVAYMLSDPFVVHLGNPPFNDAMAWLPWILLGIDTAARRARGIPMAALAIALLFISGHGQMTLYVALAAGAYALWQVTEGGWPGSLKRLGRLLIAGLLGTALAAPVLLPGLERLPFTERAGVPLELRRGYEFPPAMLVDFLSPAFHGRRADQFWPTWNRVESGYAGAVALYLAVLGLAGELRHRRTWITSGLGVLAYLLSLGYQGPLYPHLAHFPLFAESWKTARAIFIVAFVMAMMAAQGAEYLQRGRRKMALLWSAGLLLGGLLLAWWAPKWASIVPAGIYRSRALAGLRIAALLAIITALLGWLISRNIRWGRAGLILLLMAELVASGAMVEVEPSPQPDTTHTAALAFLRADSGWFRVDVDTNAWGLWPPVFLQMAGFEVPLSTGNAMDLREFNFLFWSIPQRTHPVYRMLGIKYVIVPKGAPPGGHGIWPVFVDDPTTDVHLNTLALPRVWLVYRTEVVKNYGEALERITSPDFRPEEVAIVENGPRLEGTGSGRIEVGWYGPNNLILTVHTDQPALLVLSDTFYPGWEGSVDGKRVPIYRTNAVFRGIVVPPGTHRVEMRFWPQSLRIGLGLAGMAILLCGTCWAGRRRKA